MPDYVIQVDQQDAKKYRSDLKKLQEAMDSVLSKEKFNKLFRRSNKPVVLFGPQASKDKRKRLVELYSVKIENAERYSGIVEIKELPLKDEVEERSLVIFKEPSTSVENVIKEVDSLIKLHRNIFILIITNDSAAPEFEKYCPVEVNASGRSRLEERLIELDKVKNENETIWTAMLSPEYVSQIKGLDIRIIRNLTSIFKSSAIDPKSKTFYLNGKTNNIDGDEQRFMKDISGLISIIAKHYPELVVTIFDRLRFLEIYYEKPITGRFKKLERLSNTPEMYGLSKPELKSVSFLSQIELWFRKLLIKEPHAFCIVPLRGICSFEKYGNTSTLHRNNGFWNPRSPFTDFVNKRTSLDFFEPEFWDAIISFKWHSYALSRYFLIWSMNLLFSILFAISTTPTFLNSSQPHPLWSIVLYYVVIFLGLIFLIFEIRQLIYFKWSYLGIYNFVDIITYFLPLYISFRAITGQLSRYDTDVIAVAIFFLWMHFLQSCRVFSPIGIFANVVLGGAYHILPFLFIMLLITLGFGHSLWILLDNSSSDEFANNASSINKFDNLESAIKEVYWGWTGDGSAIQTFDTEGGLVNITRGIMVFLLGIYMVNLLIAVLNEGYGNLVKKSKAAYKLQMAQLTAEIEIFYMSQSERKDPKSFPDDIYFEVSRKKIKKWKEELKENYGDNKLNFVNEYYQFYRCDENNSTESNLEADTKDENVDKSECDNKNYENYNDSDPKAGTKDKNIENYKDFEDDNIGGNLWGFLKNKHKATRINLTGKSIGNNGIDSIMKYLNPENNETPRTLELGNNNITDAGTYALFNCLKKNKNISLKILDLGGNKINFSGLRHQYIIDLKITKLILKENSIGDVGVKHLATGLKDNKSIKKLDLEWNYIKESGIKALADSLTSNTALEELILAGNEIHEEAALFLAECLAKNKALIKMDLSECEIGNDCAHALAKINNTSLKWLNLKSNYIGMEGAIKLIDLRNKDPPIFVNIQGQAPIIRNDWKKNFIPKDIITYLRDKKCTKIDLSEASINDKKVDGILVAKFLAESLKQNSTLTHLNINLNKFGDEGVKLLADSLEKNSTLTHLNINSNNISNEGVKHLAESLKKNSALTHLKINSKKIDKNGDKLLKDSLNKNKTIQELTIRGITLTL